MFLIMHQPVLQDTERLMGPATTYNEEKQPLAQQASWLPDFYLKVRTLNLQVYIQTEFGVSCFRQSFVIFFEIAF